MDFIQRPYLHQGEVSFGQRSATLDGYRIESERVAAGQPIHLALGWSVADAPLTATVSLVDMGEHLPGLHAPASISQSAVEIDAQAQVTSSHTLSTPPDLPGGVYLMRVDLQGAESGASLGQVYLRPIYVHPDQPGRQKAVMATFGDRIHLHAVHAEQPTLTQLLVRLDWSVSQAVGENYAIAVRLYNARGDPWASIDTQPGYGFLPTVTWQAGDPITDRLVLPLPEGLAPRDDYELEIILYDLANNLAGIGQYVQPGIALTQYARRGVDSPVLARIGPHLALATLDLPAAHSQGAPALSFDAGWLAMTAPAAGVVTQWSLVDQAGSAVATHTVRLEAAAWPVGAYVLDVVRMPVPEGLAAGRYHLAVALLDPQTQVEIGQASLEQTVEVAGHPRNFSAPLLDHRMDVKLGGQVQLEGYSLARDKDTLRLSLAWRALQAMPHDYTVFVHLVNAQDAIVAQYDAMPVGNTYPTSWWVAGEVVSDTITFSLKALPPGVYRLALGMYDGATQARLPAHDSNGQRLPADRIILPETVQWP